MTTPDDPAGSNPYQQPAPGSPPPYGAPQPGASQPAPPPYGAPPPQWGGGQPPYGYGAQPRGTNGFAIASLVCAFFCSPLGVVFGVIARRQIRQTGEGGDGLALAGIIISVASIVFGVLVLLLAMPTHPNGGIG